jgi:hypothetical protein
MRVPVQQFSQSISLSGSELELFVVFKLPLFRDPMNGGRMAL